MNVYIKHFYIKCECILLLNVILQKFLILRKFRIYFYNAVLKYNTKFHNKIL